MFPLPIIGIFKRGGKDSPEMTADQWGAVTTRRSGRHTDHGKKGFRKVLEKSFG